LVIFTVTPNLESFIEQLLTGSDVEREAVVADLVVCGQPAVEALISKLGASDPDVRWWVLRALSALQGPEISPWLQRGLADPDPAVRQCAALGLQSHPNSNAVNALTTALQGSDTLLARLAGNALAAIGSEAVPALLDVFKNGAASARLEAVKALAEIGDPRAIGPFFESIRDGDSGLIEYWADIGLDRMGIGMAFFDPNG
jgi:HEAT repeat protein